MTLRVVLLTLAIATTVGAAELQEFPDCALVVTNWADGDSFLVKFPDGKERTVRLYGADCLESRVNDPTDARRLRGQRRYFGITHAEPTTEKSIELAKKYGKQATAETRRMLTKAFTVHTSFADARGDPKYERVYAFVTTSKAKDLASHLVSIGLARAVGVCRRTPQDISANDYREELRDLELRAAKRGAGVWSRTDWDSLPEERRLERKEAAETALALDGHKLREGQTLDPNTASRDELMTLPGVGEVLATRIVEGRPYEKTEDLLRVTGVGKATLAKLLPFLKVGNRK